MVLTEEERRNWEAILEEANRPNAEAAEQRKAEARRLKAEAAAQKLVHRGCMLTLMSLIALPVGLLAIFITTFIKLMGTLSRQSRGHSTRRHR